MFGVSKAEIVKSFQRSRSFVNASKNVPDVRSGLPIKSSFVSPPASSPSTASKIASETPLASSTITSTREPWKPWKASTSSADRPTANQSGPR